MIKTVYIHKEVTDGVMVDITVKSGHVLSPTWNLVMSYKSGSISWEAYEKKYNNLLRLRLRERRQEFMDFIAKAKEHDVYLVCFCKSDGYCHRRLAKEFIEKLKEWNDESGDERERQNIR